MVLVALTVCALGLLAIGVILVGGLMPRDLEAERRRRAFYTNPDNARMVHGRYHTPQQADDHEVC